MVVKSNDKQRKQTIKSRIFKQMAKLSKPHLRLFKQTKTFAATWMFTLSGNTPTGNVTKQFKAKIKYFLNAYLPLYAMKTTH